MLYSACFIMFSLIASAVKFILGSELKKKKKILAKKLHEDSQSSALRVFDEESRLSVKIG